MTFEFEYSLKKVNNNDLKKNKSYNNVDRVNNLCSYMII